MGADDIRVAERSHGIVVIMRRFTSEPDVVDGNKSAQGGYKEIKSRSCIAHALL